MNALAFLAGLALAQGSPQTSPQGADPAPQTAVYTNAYIGVSITHPNDWKVAPKKTDAWITIPLKNGSTVAGLNLVAAVFNAETDIWQKSQEHMVNQLGGTIIKQWDEQILGVPLLLTKMRHSPGKLTSAIKAVPGLPADQPLITLVGLVYSATPRKLLFRLTAPESAYDDAEFLWRHALESLRTVDGRLPKPEDPNRTPDTLPDPKNTPPDPGPRLPIGPKPPSEAVKRAPKVHEATVANRKVGFYYPEGWQVEAQENGKLTLRGTNPTVTLDMALYSNLDSDPPLRALVKASGESLQDFKSVESREESRAKKNAAGATFVRVWRIGNGVSGPIFSFEAVAGDSFYCMLKLKGQGKLSSDLRKSIEDLLERISVEPIE